MSDQEKIKLPNEVYFYSAIPAKARGRIPSASPTGRRCNDPTTTKVDNLCRIPPLKRPSSPAHHYLRPQEGLDQGPTSARILLTEGLNVLERSERNAPLPDALQTLNPNTKA